jgi:diaminopimelate epimerase
MSTGLAFTKMHGLGNDFVVMDGRRMPQRDWPALARAMCDRHFGVGADQLLLIKASAHADLTMRLFNTDGFEAEMCGNGIRCVGKFAFERGLVSSPKLSIETLGGIKQLTLTLDNGRVTGARVSMGVPRVIFQDDLIEFENGSSGFSTLLMTGVDMGNPHAVAIVDRRISDIRLEPLGPLVEHHTRFPARTNFEVVNVESARRIAMRVWERSAGITLACGTGACASVVAARLAGRVGDCVEVALPGGLLTIEWDGAGEVFMTGPATSVFEGVWNS